VVIAARPFLAVIQGIGAAGSTDANVAAAASMLLAWGSADAGISLDCPTGLAAGSLRPASAVNDTSVSNSANSASCLLFHTFLRRLLETTFVDEEAVAGVGRSPVNEVRALLTLLSGQVPNPNNLFCRTVDAKGTPVQNTSCTAQVTSALGWAWAALKTAYGDVSNWRWGRIHTIRFDFIVPGYPLIDPGYRPGPYVRPGGAWTVDVGAPSLTPSFDLAFPYRSGGNVRWLAAMDGTLAHTFMQLPGVESCSPYPGDAQPTMITQWVLNQYFNFPFQLSDVTSVRSEAFTP
jgi:penicillin G amidase